MNGPVGENQRALRKGGIDSAAYKKPRFSFSATVLWGLSLFSLLLFVQAVAKDNKDLWKVPVWLSSWKVLSSEAATTLLVSFITLMVVRGQYALTTKPIFTITISPLDGGDDDDKKVLLANAPTHWRATLRNRGAGTATIKKLNYFVRYKKDGHLLETELTRDELFEILIAAGYIESVDFRLPRIVVESTLESQGSTLLFAYNKSIFDAFWIEAQFEYTSVLGVWYQKDLPCVSRQSALKYK
jgi:hypothetical protein